MELFPLLYKELIAANTHSPPLNKHTRHFTHEEKFKY